MDCNSAWWAAITVALGGLGEHEMKTQGDDGSFFLEPKLTMVISQCQDYGMITCALRSGLLKTDCKKKQLN